MADVLDMLGREPEPPAEPTENTDSSATGADPLAWSSLVLGLLGPLTLGLTSIPGICCAVMALKRASSGRSFVAVGLLLSVLSLSIPGGVALWWGPTLWVRTGVGGERALEAILTTRGLPALPTSATDVRVDVSGGAWHQNIWIRFDAPPGDCQSYLAALAPTRTQQIERTNTLSMAIMGRPDWFRPEQIMRGRRYVIASSNDQVVVNLYHDQQRGRVFITWLD